LQKENLSRVAGFYKEVTIDRGRFSCPKSLTSCFSCFPSPAVPKKGGCESYHPDDAVRHPPYRHQSFEMGGCESCVRPRCHRQSSIVTLLSSALSLCCHQHFLSSSCHSVTFSSLSHSSPFSFISRRLQVVRNFGRLSRAHPDPPFKLR
jgi:hypothetical protein